MTSRSLLDIRQLAATRAGEAERAHADAVERYRGLLTAGVQRALAAMREDVLEISGNHAFCNELVAEMHGYLDWLQWTLWDLPWLALAFETSEERFARAVPPCALAYLSLRLVDDVVDRHYDYRNRHATLLAKLVERSGRGSEVQSLAFLSGLLLCFDGLSRLAEQDADGLAPALRALRKVVIGAIMEVDAGTSIQRHQYERLIRLKNVEYGRVLHQALAADARSAFAQYLEQHSAVAQKINDVQDFFEDVTRNQPNLLALHLRSGTPAALREAGRFPPSLVAELRADFERAHALLSALSGRAQDVAWLLLHRHFLECEKQGLSLAEPVALPAAQAAASASSLAPARPVLSFDMSLREVIHQCGAAALEDVACPVCGERDAHTLLSAQGFRIARCETCAHAYVSPRLRPELQVSAGIDLEHVLDPFLTVQKMYAPAMLRDLMRRTDGRRLLDIGPGRGYFSEEARAAGFDVHAIEGSAALCEHLRPTLGKHLHHAVFGNEELPWKSFDAVVISHVLEHVADPIQSLRRVYEALRPGGLVYIAVPDLDSIHFKVLGRRWEAVAPLVHYQYFGQASLTRALQLAGFERVERVQPPPFPAALAPPWMKLFRRLGDDDIGELRVWAARPPLPRESEQGSPS